jgi:hypothetical protein
VLFSDTAVVESMPLKNKQKQFLMGLRAFLAGKHVNDGKYIIVC